MKYCIVISTMLLSLVCASTARSQQSEAARSEDVRPATNVPRSSVEAKPVEAQFRANPPVTVQVDADGNLQRTPLTYFKSDSLYRFQVPSGESERVILRDPETKKLALVSSDDLDEKEVALVKEHRLEVERALTMMRSNKGTGEERAQAKRILTEELDFQFEVDLNRRRDQLKEIEKQLADFREQLIKRENAKSKLIELKLQILENESDGLGFPSSWDLPRGSSPLPAIPYSRSRAEGRPSPATRN